MLLKTLNLNYFGQFNHLSIDLMPGINLIYGGNEAGKTTIYSFIYGMFFGIERSRGRAARTDQYMKYLPWDYPGAYEGSMEFSLDGNEYRISRSFHKDNKSFNMIDLNTGRMISLPDEDINNLIPSLTKTNFKNTISIGQLQAKTDEELADQVHNYITNLSIAKSREVDVREAFTLLNAKKRVLERSDTPDLIEEIKEVIENQEDIEKEVDRLVVRLNQFSLMEKSIIKEKEDQFLMDHRDKIMKIELFPVINEKYKSYCNLLKDVDGLEIKIKEVKKNKVAWEKEIEDTASIEDAIKEIESDTAKSMDYKRIMEDDKTNDESINSTDNKKNIGFSLVLSILICVAGLSIFGFSPMGISIVVGAIIIGTGLYLARYKSLAKDDKALDERYDDYNRQIKTLDHNISTTLNRYQVLSLEDLKEKQEMRAKLSYALLVNENQIIELNNNIDSLSDKLDSLHDEIMIYQKSILPDDYLSDESMDALAAMIDKMKFDIKKDNEELNERHRQCGLSIEKLKWDLEALEGNEGKLYENKEKWQDLEEKNKEEHIELQALNLALDTIDSLSKDIHDSFGQKLNHEVSTIISGVTHQKYTDIKLDEKLEIKVGVKDSYVELAKLSAGTIDQLYLSLRLAVADLIHGEDTMPIILDDAFAFYDDVRIQQALKELAKRRQVIIFTCQERERLALERLGLDFHYVGL